MVPTMNDLTSQWDEVTSTWSDSHGAALNSASTKLEDNWIAENAGPESDEDMLRKAFRSGFYCGAGCSHKLHELEI